MGGNLSHLWWLHFLIPIPICGCGYIGTLVHMSWSCLHICSFWKTIFHLIFTLRGFITKENIEQVILCISIDKLPPELHPMTMHILLAVDLVIMKKWKYMQFWIRERLLVTLMWLMSMSKRWLTKKVDQCSFIKTGIHFEISPFKNVLVSAFCLYYAGYYCQTVLYFIVLICISGSLIL